MSNMIVETQYGRVQGISDGAIGVWKGIPFAQPPVGPLRFHAPQRPLPWTGVRDATLFGSIAAQLNETMGSLQRYRRSRARIVFFSISGRLVLMISGGLCCSGFMVERLWGVWVHRLV